MSLDIRYFLSLIGHYQCTACGYLLRQINKWRHICVTVLSSDFWDTFRSICLTWHSCLKSGCCQILSKPERTCGSRMKRERRKWSGGTTRREEVSVQDTQSPWGDRSGRDNFQRGITLMIATWCDAMVLYGISYGGEKYFSFVWQYII